MALRRMQRDRIDLALDDGAQVAVERVRDPRARRLKLLIGERGVRLTVPPGVGAGEAQAFLESHRVWLRGQLARAARQPEPEPLRVGETAQIPLRGMAVPLRWQQARYAHAELTACGLVIGVPARAGELAARRALRECLLAEARTDLGRWLPRYLPGLPRPPSALRLRPLRSLWGSLSPDDALSLDLALVLGPPAAFEYVLVHELCHLVQRNHSPRFWREVEARWPQWRAQRDYLHGQGLGLKAALRALVG